MLFACLTTIAALAMLWLIRSRLRRSALSVLALVLMIYPLFLWFRFADAGNVMALEGVVISADTFYRPVGGGPKGDRMKPQYSARVSTNAGIFEVPGASDRKLGDRMCVHYRVGRLTSATYFDYATRGSCDVQ